MATRSPVQAVVLAHGVNGLGATRSLGEAGIPHAVVCAGASNPARFSRYPTRTLRVRIGATDGELLATLSSVSGQGAALLGTSDAYIDFLSRQREALVAAGFAVVCPPRDLGAMLNDKATELALVRNVAIDIPKSLTALLPTAGAVIARLGLPIIIKPRSYRSTSLIASPNVIVRDRATMEQFLARHAEHLDGFVAQELIDGNDEALWVCNCLFGDGGKLLQAFTFQRLRTVPPHFGATSSAVGRENPVIKRLCAAVGKALGYAGPAMIEFKFSAAADRYFYIETNPRLGMCNIFDTRSGVNNVAAAVRMARGEPDPVTAVAQRDGVYYLNFLADLESRLSDGERLPAILLSYARTAGARHAWAFFSLRDPYPWVRVVIVQLAYAVRRIVRRARAGHPRRIHTGRDEVPHHQ